MLTDAISYITQENLPHSLTCSITKDLIKKPVKLPGDSLHVFEESAAVAWLSEKRINPLTREPLLREPLVRDTATQRNLEVFRTQAARIQTALGEPRQGAARTIQAAWRAHVARQPVASLPRCTNQELNQAMENFELAQHQAEQGEQGCLQGGMASAQGFCRSTDARYAAQQARNPLALDQVSVRWEKVAKATSPALAEALHASLTSSDGPSLETLASHCAAEGHEMQKLLLADDASPLRLMADRGAFKSLRDSAQWVRSGTYAGGKFLFDVPRPGARHFGACDEDQRPEGRGTRLYDDGQTGSGDWSDGVPHGLFCQAAPDGTVIFAGRYDDGSPAMGERLLPHGTYFGDIDEGEPHGLGQLSGPFGTYCGVFDRGMPNTGSMIFPSNNRSVGTLVDEEDELRLGILIYSDGTKYQGLHHGDLRHGPGVLSTNSGEEHIGIWDEGTICGPGALRLPHGLFLGDHRGDDRFEVWAQLDLRQ